MHNQCIIRSGNRIEGHAKVCFLHASGQNASKVTELLAHIMDAVVNTPGVWMKYLPYWQVWQRLHTSYDSVRWTVSEVQEFLRNQKVLRLEC